MQFGLVCSAQADNGAFGPETGQGFRDYLDFNVEAEVLGFYASFLVEHHCTGWNQVIAVIAIYRSPIMEVGIQELKNGLSPLSQARIEGRVGGRHQHGRPLPASCQSGSPRTLNEVALMCLAIRASPGGRPGRRSSLSRGT
jgi:hypothetical protein